MKKGYTLIEVILYSALFVLLLGAIVNAGLLLSRSYSEIKSERNVQMSALSVMDQMTRHIRTAESIDGSGTAYGTSNGSLLLRSTDTGGTAHTVTLYLSGGRVQMSKEGAVFGPLTDASISVSSLVFRHIVTGNSEGVKIEMTIDGRNFYNTVMLRGSYN